MMLPSSDKVQTVKKSFHPNLSFIYDGIHMIDQIGDEKKESLIENMRRP
jgi:hypothetical protein